MTTIRTGAGKKIKMPVDQKNIFNRLKRRGLYRNYKPNIMTLSSERKN